MQIRNPSTPYGNYYNKLFNVILLAFIASGPLQTDNSVMLYNL